MISENSQSSSKQQRTSSYKKTDSTTELHDQICANDRRSAAQLQRNVQMLYPPIILVNRDPAHGLQTTNNPTRRTKQRQREFPFVRSVPQAGAKLALVLWHLALYDADVHVAEAESVPLSRSAGGRSCLRLSCNSPCFLTSSSFDCSMDCSFRLKCSTWALYFAFICNRTDENI